MLPLRYAFEEACVSLWRGRRSALLAILTIALAIFVLGGFLIVAVNLNDVTEQWTHEAGMSVYLDDGITGADRAAVERMLAPGSVVAGFDFLSKDAAVARFKTTFADLATGIDALGTNPLPASYEVRLQPSAAAAADALGRRVRELPGVVDVRYDRQWIERVLSTVAVIRRIGFSLSAILAAAAMLTVANVVRLALHARQDELTIMRLVGAPTVYVRGPFVMEGVLQGGAGALVALGLLAAAFYALRRTLLTPLAGLVAPASVRFMTFEAALLLVAGGLLVGCAGGLIAAADRSSSRNLVTES